MSSDVSDDATGAPRDEEDEKERRDRELMELMQELRVALTGVQVLFAFLLTVPFTQRWARVTEFQRQTYFVTLIAASLSVLLLIAPTARHRLLFRQHDKEALLHVSNLYSVAGLMALAIAMTGAVLLITDLLYKDTTVVVVGGTMAFLFTTIWFVVPLLRRRAHDGGD
jgi:hypothetical protein